MRPLGVRAPVVVGVMAIVLALLIGAQYVFTVERIDRPLHDRIAAVAGVRSVRVDTSRDPIVVDVRLDPVPNLMETYAEIRQAADDVLAGRPYEIRVEDRRNEKLVDDYYSMNAIIQEGLATGRFTDMVARVEAAAKELGLDSAKVYVDSDRLFVQLRAGNAYLYEVLPRRQATEGRAGQ